MNKHHLEDKAIMSLVKVVLSTPKAVGNSKDLTPEWVRQTIRKVEEDLGPKIEKYKRKKPKFKRFLVHNRDSKTWEVWQKGVFGRDKFLVAAEYRREVEEYLYDC